MDTSTIEAPEILSPAAPSYQPATMRSSAAPVNSRGSDPQFKFQLGNLLFAQGGFDEAAMLFSEVLAIRPDFAAAHNNLGNALSKLGQTAEAVAHYRRAVALAPAMAEAHNNLGCALFLLGQLGPAIAHYKEAIDLNAHAPAAYTNLVLALHYVPGVTSALISEAARRWAGALPGRLSRPSYRTVKDLARPLRIGYVSGDFRNHPVAYFIENLLAAHDREAVEVFCYGNATVGDATTVRIAEAADHWRDISSLTDHDAAHRITEDAIDILIDLCLRASRHRSNALGSAMSAPPAFARSTTSSPIASSFRRRTMAITANGPIGCRTAISASRRRRTT
jgi:protein O-GlcNAc transferase